jgi:hypothetical protein
MFAWLRKLYWNGEIPPKPCDKDLDWPEEQEWQFCYDQWKWVAHTKENNPYEDWETKWASIEENSPVIIDDEVGVELVEKEPSHHCEGGVCQLHKPPKDPVN